MQVLLAINMGAMKPGLKKIKNLHVPQFVQHLLKVKGLSLSRPEGFGGKDYSEISSQNPRHWHQKFK